MNKSTHRLIFNAARGCTMAVGETASSCTKNPSGTPKARRRSLKCAGSARSDGFSLSKVPLTQWICARAAPDLIVFAAHNTASSNAIVLDSANYATARQSSQLGSQVSSTGNLRLQAGQDITATAASLQSTGNTSLSAGNTITLAAGQSTNATTFGMTTSDGDMFGTTKTTERRSTDQTRAVATTVGGNTVNVTAGQDINVKGSSVIADKTGTLSAGNNVNIEAGVNTASQTSFFQKTESGVLSGGGLGITIGSRSQSTEQASQSTTAAASTVGSISSNINIVSGQTYRQVGSDVIAPVGDINITAKKVDIVEARETTASQTETKFKQSGISVGISNPLLSAAQGAQSMGQAIGNTSDGRMQALGLASAGLTAYNTVNSLTDKAGNFDAAKATDISINVSIGSSKSQSNSSSQSDTARGSTVAAGNNINITATGAGQQSDLTIQGSSVKAGGNTTLAADNQVNLQAAQNTSSQTSTNSSSSSSVGVSYSAISGFGFSVSASKGQGSGNGSDTSFTNTSITAGNTAIIQSGGDTNVRGAVVAANTIKANVGGNLNIASLQDTSTYTSQQSSAGASLSFGGGGITGGGVSASKSNIDSNFQSVNQQSGLKAGDGGFQVAVANNTALTGSVIASTQAAVDNNKNTFTTGSALTITDIQNQASFKGSAVGVSASMGVSKDPTSGNTNYSPGGSAGVGSASGNAASTTTAGISGIAGNTAVRRGDAEAGIQRIFDAAKVQREINAQVAITQAFGQQASKAVGDYAGQKLKEAIANKDSAAIENWKEGGTARVALHVLVGGLGGGIGGALGAGVSAQATPVIAANIAALDISFEAKSALIQGLSAALGVAVGGSAGGAAAFNETSNNFLPTLIRAGQLAQRAAQVGLDKLDEAGIATLRACTTNPTCTALVQSVLPVSAFAWLAAQNTVQTGPSLVDLIPTGYGAGTQPTPAGPIATPIASPLGPNNTSSPTDQPAPAVSTGGSTIPAPTAGNGAVGGGFGAGGVPVFNPLTMAVPPNLLGSDGKLLPGINGSGTPIPMPSTSNPNQSAEDFAKNAFNGQTPTNIKNDLVGSGSWLATLPDGTTVLYRPAGQGTRTEAETASVDINSADIRTLNRNQPAKFKFPKE